MSVTGLLDLEAGMLRHIRDPQLRQCVQDFGPPGDQPDREADEVLLACAHDWLQEGDGGRALWLARHELDAGADDPDLWTLVDGIVMDPWPQTEVSRARTAEYLVAKGYGPDRGQPFLAAADVFLGRVQRGLTHPALGARCIPWHATAVRDRSGTVRFALGNELVLACERLVERWDHAAPRDRQPIEDQLRVLADSWLRDRVVPGGSG